MNGEFFINDGEPFQVNTFYNGSDQLTKSVEKVIDKQDETLEMFFSVYIIKYTMVCNQIKRSIYGKGCDAFNNVLEDKRQLCYIPTGNACFRKCFAYNNKRDFPNEYKEFIQDYDRCKKMTLARVQSFSKKYKLKRRVFKLNTGRIIPETVRERNICLYLHKNHFCVTWKLNRKTGLLESIKEIEDNFRFEKTR